MRTITVEEHYKEHNWERQACWLCDWLQVQGVPPGDVYRVELDEEETRAYRYAKHASGYKFMDATKARGTVTVLPVLVLLEAGRG